MPCDFIPMGKLKTKANEPTKQKQIHTNRYRELIIQLSEGRVWEVGQNRMNKEMKRYKHTFIISVKHRDMTYTEGTQEYS